MEVLVFNRQRALPLPFIDGLRTFAVAAAGECRVHTHRGGGSAVLGGLDLVEISLVSDAAIARVHRRFMSIRGATDVITFEHGEIVISVATAARQAGEHGQTLEEELRRYIVHGLLHLSGFEDGEPAAAAEMWRAQEEALRSLERI